MKIHPLQKKSISLLKKLCHEKNLALTRAMITVEEGYYPSIESVLETLKHYKKDSFVENFIKQNVDLIKKVETELNERKIEETAKNDKDISKLLFKTVNVYKAIKSKSIAEIEDVLSKELSVLCNEELKIEIVNIQGDEEYYYSNVEMKVIVKKNSDF
jgi:hypothetical protein